MTCRALPLVLVATLAAAAAAQQPPPEPKDEPRWPELTREQQQQVKRLCQTLRETQKDERRQKAEAELVSMGSGVAPLLLKLLSDYRVNINDSLARVLDQVTEPSHAPLLAVHASDHAAAVRTYVLRRLTAFHLPAMAPVFRECRKDRDPDVAFLAALGQASAGDLGGMDEIFERAMADWDAVDDAVAVALPGARGEAASHWVMERVAGGEERAQVTGLRLMRYVGEPGAAGAIAAYLDAENHNVKKAAINALRVVVDGEPPLEKLSVFDAIEMARTWKAKVR